MQSFIVLASLVSELTGEVKMTPLTLEKTPQSLGLTGPFVMCYHRCRCKVVIKLLSTKKSDWFVFTFQRKTH